MLDSCSCVFVENQRFNVAWLNTFLAFPVGILGIVLHLRRPSRVPVASVCRWDRLEALCGVVVVAKIQILVDHNHPVKRSRNGRPTLRTGLPLASAGCRMALMARLAEWQRSQRAWARCRLIAASSLKLRFSFSTVFRRNGCGWEPMAWTGILKPGQPAPLIHPSAPTKFQGHH